MLLDNILPRRVKSLARQLLIGNPGGRSLSVKSTDVFIVSYPKSGNTWTRFIIGNLLYDSVVDFSNVEDRIPDIYINADKKMYELPSPRILKSHEYFDPRYKKVIYIVRDPRDVVVSYYHFVKKRNWIAEQVELDEFVQIFVSGSFDNYGTWAENVGSWLGARSGDKNLLLLRYEDMLSDTEAALKNISEFMGITHDDEKIKRAIASSSFDRMKELETTQSLVWSATRDSRQDMPFMRSGKSGGWQNSLSKFSANLIEEKWSDTMKKVGYLI